MAFNRQKNVFSLALIGLIGFAYVLIPLPVEAALINGSFEDDRDGWITGGQTETLTASFGITPTDGFRQVFISNAAGSPSTGADGLEDFLGVPIGIFDDIGGLGEAKQGSAIRQDFAVQSGDIISFDWNFVTDDSINNDYGFVIFAKIDELNTLTNEDLFKIFRGNPNLVPSASRFAEESTYQLQPLSFSPTTSGTYRLAFGVIDVVTVTGESAILVDNVRQVTDIPESSPLYSLIFVGIWLIATHINN